MATKDISDEQVCRAYSEYQRNLSRYPYQLLSAWTGEPEKVCYRAMERADRRGLIEYGVSLRTGWLTEKGIQLLLDSVTPTPSYHSPRAPAADSAP